MIIDDGSADFSTVGSCWGVATGFESYNNGYRRAPTSGDGSCTARWNVRGDAFTPPGDYDVFVRIPADTDASLSAAYDIYHYDINHQIKGSRAVVVQVAYVNNNEHDAWAYLGRYHFDMPANGGEYVVLYDENPLGDNEDHYFLADAVMLAPAGEAEPPVDFLYVSFTEFGYAGNVYYADEDILLFDAATGEWRMFFDGSDVGLAGVDIDAVDYRNGHLFFSLDAPFGGFTDADIIRFVPTSLGEDTSGTMSVFISGAKAGLTTASEDVDALTFAPGQGTSVLLSTLGMAEVNEVIYMPEDLIFPTGDEKSAGMFFNGALHDLSGTTENVNGAWLAPNGRIYLSTTGSFAVPGISGDGADIFVCAPGFIEYCLYEPGLFWNGSAHGIQNIGIDALYLGGYIPLPGECGNLPLNCSFEEQFAHWMVDVPENADWTAIMNEAHSGWYSARGEITGEIQGDNLLISFPITVQPEAIEYRFSFYGQTSNASVHEAFGTIYWYNDDIYLGQMAVGAVHPGDDHWTLFVHPFACPFPEANRAVFVFGIQQSSFGQGNDQSPGAVEYFFIDDARVESRPNANCPTLNSGGN